MPASAVLTPSLFTHLSPTRCASLPLPPHLPLVVRPSSPPCPTLPLNLTPTTPPCVQALGDLSSVNPAPEWVSDKMWGEWACFVILLSLCMPIPCSHLPAPHPCSLASSDWSRLSQPQRSTTDSLLARPQPLHPADTTSFNMPLTYMCGLHCRRDVPHVRPLWPLGGSGTARG